jgi:hypothetical protein
MKIITSTSMLALMGMSFIMLNNCGSDTNTSSEEDSSFSPEQDGSASYLAILAQPPFGYPVAPGIIPPFVNIEVACGDGVDNDGDGLVDCMDIVDCGIHPVCSEFGPPLPDIRNDRSITVYPNGLLVPEDVAFLNKLSARHDNPYGIETLFPYFEHDCYISPLHQDPFYNIPLGEPLIAGPDGPIGPQLTPEAPAVFFGPRAGLINECGWGEDLIFRDDDNHSHRRVNRGDDDDNGPVR